MTFDEVEEGMVLVSKHFKQNPYIIWVLDKSKDSIRHKMTDFDGKVSVGMGTLDKESWDKAVAKALVLLETLDEPTRRLVVSSLLP
jgi:hypothetical protein